MHKTMRLIYTRKCHKQCELCANKFLDFKNIPKIKFGSLNSICEVTDYKEIVISGGEPLLEVDRLINDLEPFAKYATKQKHYLYTCLPFSVLKNNLRAVITLFGLLDGITFTVHDKDDLNSLIYLYKETESKMFRNMNNWLRIEMRQDSIPEYLDQKGSVDLIFSLKNHLNISNVKSFTMHKGCPVPEHEDLRQLEEEEE